MHFRPEPWRGFEVRLVVPLVDAYAADRAQYGTVTSFSRSNCLAGAAGREASRARPSRDAEVFTIYDPSLGFASGGGTISWPGSGLKTNFGFSAKYGKNGTNPQGSVLVIRHKAGGSVSRLKSKAFGALSVGGGGGFGWAKLSGQSARRSRRRPLTWPKDVLNAEENHHRIAMTNDATASAAMSAHPPLPHAWSWRGVRTRAILPHPRRELR